MDDRFYYDEVSAERPILWIEKYCTTGNGSPFRLLEYQKRDIIRPMFGWKNKSDGTYKHRFCYIEIGKGNGKSGLLSALAAFLCYAAGEQNAEVYCIANDRKQAGIIHDDIKKLVNASEKLRTISKVLRDTITYPSKGNKIVAVSSDVGGSHGWRPSAIVFDELHTYKDSELFDSYVAGLIKRPNSMAFILTTAGKRETFAETIHDLALSIWDGTTKSDYWHVAIYAATIDQANKAPFEEETFLMANPAYGELIRPEDFAVIIDRAKNTPSNMAIYKQLHLNVWTGKMEDWLTAEEWLGCNIGIPEEEWKDCPAFGGLDLASTRDITAFTLLFTLPDGRIKWKSWMWIPSETVQARIAQENMKYQEWVDNGWIRTTPGNAQDHDQISDEIIEICSDHNVTKVYYDSWGAIGAVPKLVNARLPMFPIRQGPASLSAPTKELERCIVKKIIDHEGNPVLSWMANNCKVITDVNDNIRLTKADKNSKIDGMDSCVNAMAAFIDGKHLQEQLPDDWVPFFF